MDSFCKHFSENIKKPVFFYFSGGVIVVCYHYWKVNGNLDKEYFGFFYNEMADVGGGADVNNHLSKPEQMAPVWARG